MTPEELLENIKKFESTLTPEERLKWLHGLNEKIKEKDEQVKGYIRDLQTAKDEKDIAHLKEKMHKDISDATREAL